jgi:hypothetical protein
MATVTRLKCDACHTEVDIVSPAASGWFRIQRQPVIIEGRRVASMFDDECADLCSVPCIASWANRRELASSERF